MSALLSAPPHAIDALTTAAHTIRTSSCFIRTISRLYLKHQLADVNARLHDAMRLGGIGQRNGLVHHDEHRTRFDERPYMRLHLAVEPALRLHRARTQCGSGNRQTPLQDWNRADRAAMPAELCNLYETAIH